MMENLSLYDRASLRRAGATGQLHLVEDGYDLIHDERAIPRRELASSTERIVVIFSTHSFRSVCTHRSLALVKMMKEAVPLGVVEVLRRIPHHHGLKDTVVAYTTAYQRLYVLNERRNRNGIIIANADFLKRPGRDDDREAISSLVSLCFLCQNAVSARHLQNKQKREERRAAKRHWFSWLFD